MLTRHLPFIVPAHRLCESLIVYRITILRGAFRPSYPIFDEFVGVRRSLFLCQRSLIAFPHSHLVVGKGALWHLCPVLPAALAAVAELPLFINTSKRVIKNQHIVLAVSLNFRIGTYECVSLGTLGYELSLRLRRKYAIFIVPRIVPTNRESHYGIQRKN